MPASREESSTELCYPRTWIDTFSVTYKYISLHFDNHFDYYRCIVLINIYAILTKVEVIILDICQVFLVCFFTARDEVATMDS